MSSTACPTNASSSPRRLSQCRLWSLTSPLFAAGPDGSTCTSVLAGVGGGHSCRVRIPPPNPRGPPWAGTQSSPPCATTCSHGRATAEHATDDIVDDDDGTGMTEPHRVVQVHRVRRLVRVDEDDVERLRSLVEARLRAPRRGADPDVHEVPDTGLVDVRSGHLGMPAIQLKNDEQAGPANRRAIQTALYPPRVRTSGTRWIETSPRSRCNGSRLAALLRLDRGRRENGDGW
jgi:hypothetical protein